jgi:NAD(P)-dependent dehydrogenase (short-subunit alcohol dehydrogenase family)
MLLKDKVALITGAGSGIGRASAIRFAQEGAKVMVADVRTESAGNTAAEIGQAGGTAKSLAVDVRIAAEVERMVNETMRVFGRIDILFNNAGVYIPRTNLRDCIFAAGTSQQIWSRSGMMHPLGRNGKPEEVAALAAFLASDQAAFITGVAVPIDGGFNAGAWIPPELTRNS